MKFNKAKIKVKNEIVSNGVFNILFVVHVLEDVVTVYVPSLLVFRCFLPSVAEMVFVLLNRSN